LKNEQQPSLLLRLFRLSTLVEPHEFSACALSFLMVFLLMGSYYIMRPLRDGMASDWSDAEVSFLWTLNFFISTAAVFLYGWAVKLIRFHLLVPSVYAFFAATFVCFYIGFLEPGYYKTLVDKIFYVWVSVFSLFNISVFWSFMSDLYTKEQASRLFPVVGAGASGGALLGPAAPTLLTPLVGIKNLVLLSASVLLVAVPLALVLLRLKGTLRNKEFSPDIDRERIGGNPLAGFRAFFTNPNLFAIGIFIILYTSVSSIIYFEQKNLLAPFDRMERSQILGAVDWSVNILTFGIAFFASGRIVKYWGMPITLSSIPFATVFGLMSLATFPLLMVTLGLQIARRAGEYALIHPAREMLFTLVGREDRFKAKPVIDIVAYRGGDMVTSWAFAALTEGIGLGLSAMAAIGAAVSMVLGLVGIFLGKWFDRTKNI
jgi:ATP:ADP antiporter, AAA family